MKLENGSPFILIGIGMGIFWWVFESVVHVVFFKADSFLAELFTTDHEEIWMRLTIAAIFIIFALFAHVSLKKLQEAQNKIKILSGLLPICAGCKKIRDNKGMWNNIEDYISNNSEAHFTHGICPECNEQLYGGLVF